MRKTRVLAALAPALFAALLLSACGGVPLRNQRSSDEVKVIHDLRYWSGEGSSAQRNVLDVYLPTTGTKWPTMIVVHGGAWTVGGKRYMGNVGYALAENGIAAVCINYRLSPGVKHPSHIKDVARAVAWTVENLPRYGAETREVFLLGHSAGGHLVSLAGVKESYLEHEGVKKSRIAGVVSISGVYEINHEILESVFGTNRETWRKASPMNYVDGDDPPFLILFAQNEMHGAVPLVKQAEDFYQELRSNNVDVQIYEIPGANHNTIVGQVGKGNSRTLQLVLKFIDEHE